MRSLTLCSLVALSSFALNAQNSYTLAQLIDRVLTENYQVKIVSNESLIAENNNTLGNAGFLPTVDLEAQQNTTLTSVRQELSTGVVNTGTNAQSSGLSGMATLNWTVFDGFRMFAMRDQLGLLSEASRIDTRYYIEQTVADVAATYYQLIKEHSLLENYQEALAVSRFRYQLEEKKKTIGASTALLFNQAKADYLADSALAVEQSNVIRSMELEINRLINDSLDQSIALPQTSFEPAAIESKSQLIKSASEANRDLKRAFIEEMIAETNRRIQQANRYPQIDLFANYSFSRQSNEVGFIRSNQNIGPGFGVSVRFNLYNGGNTNRAINNAEISQENASHNQKSTEQLVESAVLLSYYRQQNATDRLLIAQERERSAETSLNIARQQYEAGAINGYDFRQTQIGVINAKNIVAHLKFEIKASEIELFRLSGNLMDKNLGK